MFETSRQIQPAFADTEDASLGFGSFAGIDLRRIVYLLWRDKITIVWTTAIAVLMAVMFVLVVPARYTAVTQILIDPTDLHAVGNDPTPPTPANDAAVLQVESQVRVLTSDSVLRRAIKAEGLDRDPDVVSQPSWFGSADADESAAALNALRRKIQVKRAERTYVIDVSVTASDPFKAARIANALAQAYLTEQTDVRSDAARQVSQSLSARLNELKDRVRDAEDRVQSFKAHNNLLDASGHLISDQQLTELNNQLGVARARAAAAKARLDQVEHVQVGKDEIGAFPEAVQSQTITALRTQYAEIMRREAEQMTSLGERHPAVIEIQAQAARLRHMIEDEVRRIALSARSEYEAARANEQTLAGDLEKLKSIAVGNNEAMITLRELEREAGASRSVYETFLVRARETREQERVDTKNIRVISRAEPPLRRSFPPSNTLLALGSILIGVAAGSGLILVRATYDNELPRARATGGLRSRLTGAIGDLWPGSSPSSIPILGALPNVDIPFALRAAENPRSRFAMELRKIYDTVQDSHRIRGNPSILVVASSDEDDTVAVALTLAAVAAATQRVLLVDADLECRTLAAIDADQNEAGLVDVAVGRRALSEVIARDRETNINVTSFVSRGSRRSGQINEADVKAAFEQTKRFDLVVVTSVNLRPDPGTRFFAGLVDHIVLVVRADEQNTGRIEQFIEQLGRDARKVRGAVLTGAGGA